MSLMFSQELQDWHKNQNIDMSALLAETDARLISKLDLRLYLKIIISLLNKPFKE